MAENLYSVATEGINTIGNLGKQICQYYDNRNERPHLETMAKIQLGGTAVTAFAGLLDTGLGLLDNWGERISREKICREVCDRDKQIQRMEVQKVAIEKECEKEINRMKDEKEIRLQMIEKESEKEIQRMNNEKEIKIVEEQRRVIEKIIDAMMAVYSSKVEFLKAQLNSITETYNTESRLLQEHIRLLETERTKSYDNSRVYALLSQDIMKLQSEQTSLRKEYHTSCNNLTDAIKYLEVDPSLCNQIPSGENFLLLN